MHMKKIQLQKGFTLIELLVVIAIVLVVASILLFNYSNFSSTVSLNNLAQEVGLTIRQAQSYATSVRSINGFTTDAFPAYGITFSLDMGRVSVGLGGTGATTIDPYDAGPAQFVLFADTNNNGSYDSDSQCGTPAANGTECVSAYTITTGERITALSYDSALGTSCITSGSATVLFHRPSPDADISVHTGLTTVHPSYLAVTLTTPQDISRTVRIWNTGQISVDTAKPDCISLQLP
jgi:prepilin-type N-terminal cleavage/methylation domain-containing protein